MQPVSDTIRKKNKDHITGPQVGLEAPSLWKLDASDFAITSNNFQDLRVPSNQHHKIAQMTYHLVNPLILLS